MLPTGVLVSCLAVLAGGFIGSLLKTITPENLKQNLPLMFGIGAFGIGVNSVIKAHSMSPVLLAVIVGYIIGYFIHLQENTIRFFSWLVRTLHLGGKDIDMDFYITAVALFCCSGLGWYGAITEGITGDPSILLSKSVLDFFTALVFAGVLGFSICAIPLPQIVILLAVFGISRGIAPFLTPTMFADLSACGGVLTLAAALRVAKIKDFPLVDMMPALILIMPFSALWSSLMG